MVISDERGLDSLGIGVDVIVQNNNALVRDLSVLRQERGRLAGGKRSAATGACRRKLRRAPAGALENRIFKESAVVTTDFRRPAGAR